MNFPIIYQNIDELRRSFCWVDPTLSALFASSLEDQLLRCPTSQGTNPMHQCIRYLIRKCHDKIFGTLPVEHDRFETDCDLTRYFIMYNDNLPGNVM